MRLRKRLSTMLALLALAALTRPATGTDSEVMRLDFDDPGWSLEGDDSVVETFDGRTALRLKTGSATYREVEFGDGTIEFDMQVTPHRAFAYIYFRMQSDEEHEEVYFRSHKSRLPDAIQYAPVYSGRSQWQLYHDAGSTAAAVLPAGEWIPVKLVVQGSRAAVFVGDVSKPQLHIRRLAHDARSGYLAFRSFMTFGTPPDTYVANFANPVIRPGVVEYEFPAEEPEAASPGRIATWDLSPAFAPAEGDVLELPELSPDAKWTMAQANEEGLLEIERHVVRPEGARRASVLARLQIPSTETTTRRLDLGFSDEVSVFLNGRLLAVDDESYSFNLPRRQGLLTIGQLSLFLPLEAGSNELVLVVTDRFGGWGLSGRLD